MNRNLLTILLVFFTFGLYAQVVVQENFESTPLSVTSSSTGTGVWALNTRVHSQGLQSDSAVITAGDTTYLTTASFSTLNKFSVTLEFDQICKIDFFDSAIVQYSVDNGATFHDITGGYYLGNGGFASYGDRFNAYSYVDWAGATADSVTNAMWRTETFNLSPLVANYANVKVRFKLVDAGITTDNGYPGWFIDSLKITATFSEMTPPTLTMIPPIIQDTSYTSGPFNVRTYIYDDSGLDTAVCIYSVMPSGFTDTIAMILDTSVTDTFFCDIPFHGFGRTISYYIKAIDNSFAHNVDSTSTYSFFCKNALGGDYVIGDGTTITTSTVANPFGQFYTGNKNQFLILASELQALGASGGNISSIAFDVTTTNIATSTGSNHDDFTVKIKSTSTSGLTSTFETGLTQVYTDSTYQTVLGWNTFTFTTPFAWDGASNIIIETCFDNGSNNYSGNASIHTNSTTFNSVTNKYSDAVTNECAETTGNTSSTRPDMKLVLQTSSSLINDIGVNNIVSPISGAAAGVSTPVEVTLKNFGIDTVTTATIDWEYDGVSQNSYSFTDSLKSDSVSSNIVLGNITPTAGSHSIKAWSSNPNGISDFDLSNDDSYFEFYACSGALSGTYTIGGTSADYSSFHDAALALNQCGINGAVVFNVASGTYNENLNLSYISGISATNTITFQSVTGDSTDVILAYDATGTVDNYVVMMNGVSYITFKDMTFEAQDANYARVFVMNNSTHNIDINSNIIKATQVDSFSNNNMALIFAIDSTLGSDISITNNNLHNGSYGINLLGLDNDSSTNWVISNNIIKGHTKKAIWIIKAVSVQITGNDIETDTSSHVDDYQGIYLENNSGSPVISKNKLLTTATSFGYGISLVNSVFDTASYASISNNFIQIFGNTTSNSLSCGILVFDSKNIDIYYNSIRATGSMSASCALSLYTNLAGSIKNINIVNNNLTNDADGYVYYIKNVDTALFINNHNNLYQFTPNGKFAFLNTVVSSFTDWENVTGGSNLYSINPYFANSLDLHVGNNLFKGLGTSIAGISDDIDGDVRDSSTPDIGADEFELSPWDAMAFGMEGPMGGCGLTTSEVVTMKIINLGSNDISGNFIVKYQLLGSSNIVSENVTSTIISGDTVNYSFNTGVNLDVSSLGADSIFIIHAWCELSGDNVLVNDTAVISVFSGYIPSVPTVTGATVNYSTSGTLYASGNFPYFWESDTINNFLVQDTFYITPQLYDTATYWVSNRMGSGVDSITVGTGSILNSHLPIEAYFGYTYSQTIYKATYLNNKDGYIRSISYKYNGSNGFGPDNIKIYLGTTTNTSFASDTSWIPLSNLSLAYDGTITTPSGGGWVELVMTIPFYYNGVDNLIIALDENTPGYHSSTDEFEGSNMDSDFKSIYFYNDSNNPNPASPPTSGYTKGISATSPNIQIVVDGGGSCFSSRVPVVANVIGFPGIDAGVSAIVNPSGNVLAGSSQTIQAEISNYGLNTLTSVDVIWMKTGAQPDTFNYSGSIAYQHKDTVDLAVTSFDPGVQSVIAWTSNPNNTTDTINSNDTSFFAFNACLSGTYTIGDTAGGAIFDFPNFNSAVTALSGGGVCGNVIFLVDTGYYDERFVIPSISGVGPNATVTFTSANGDSSQTVINYTSGSSAAWVVKVSSDYIIFDKLTISRVNGVGFGRIIELAGSASNFTLTNCILNGIVSTSSSSSYAVLYGDNTSHNNINIINNSFTNGSSSIYIGSYSSTSNSGLTVNNNSFNNFTYYGLYLYIFDSININMNNFNGKTTTTGSQYGIYMSNVGVFSINKNNIRIFPGGSYGTGYGLYCSNASSITVANKALISNNYIHFGSGSYNNTGIYLSSAKFVDIFYNTIYNSYGSTSNKSLYVYSYGTTYTNINIINNLFRDSLGIVLYVSNPGNIGVIDHNVYYTDTANANFAYWGSNKSDLAALQTASSQDANSQAIDPVFVYTDSVRLASAQLSTYGIPLTRVLDDIEGEIRSSNTTTPGADEVKLLAIDIGLESIVNLPTTTTEFQMVTVDVDVKNYGLDTIYAFDVEYLVNNANAVTYNYSGLIAPEATETITLAAFSAPAGNATFCAKTVLATDSNVYNDIKCKPFFSIPIKDANMLMVYEIEPYCGITYETVKVKITNVGIDTINASNQTTPPTIYYTVNNGSVISETFSTVVAPNDTVDYSFTTLAYLGTNNFVDSTYVINSWIKFPNDNNAVNDSAATSLEVIHIPQPPTVISPVSTPYGTQTTLTAMSPDSMFWHKDDTSSLILGEGSNYLTPYLYIDDTFRVNAVSGGTGGDQIIGTDNVVNQHLPLEMYYGYTYSQSIFLPTDFDGVFGNITTVSYYYNGNSSITGDDIQIYMGTTNNNSFTSNSDWLDYNNLTLVFTGTLNTTPTPGWITFTLNIPFNYDGNSNLVIAFDENTPGYHSSGDDFYCTQVGSGRSIYYYSDGTNPDPMNPVTGNLSSYIPDTKLEVIPSGCPSSRVPVAVTVGAQSNTDAGVISLESPISGVYMSSTEDVTIKVKNFGLNSQTNVPVSYLVNGGAVVNDVIPGTIASGDTATFTFNQTVDMSNMGNNFNFKTYTSLTGDATALNDTLNESVMSEYPVYCVSKAMYTSYSEITDVRIGSVFHNASAPSNATYTNFMATTQPAFIQIGVPAAVHIKTSFPPGSSYSYGGFLKVYIDYNRDGDFEDANEEVFVDTSASVSNLIGSFTVPVGVQPGVSAMRIVQVVGYSVNSPSDVTPCGTYTYGETEDYLVNIAVRIPNDLGVEAILSPTTISNSQSPNLKVRLRNFGLNTASTFNVKYTVNNGAPINYVYSGVPIAPLDSTDINIGSINVAQGTSIIKVYTELAGDSVNVNDTAISETFVTAYATLSYFDDFDGNNLWFNDTLENQWELGKPTATNIDSAHSLNNVWAINLDGNYDNNSDDRLYSPIFIFPAIVDSAVLSFWQYIDCDSLDGGYMQFKDGVNSNWLSVGYVSDAAGTNWFNNIKGGTSKWSYENSGWVHSEYKINFTSIMNSFFMKGDTIQFRYVFYSNSNNNSRDGWAIDDFKIELPGIPDDVGVVAITSPSQSVQTGSTVDVTIEVKNYGSNLITSIPVSYTVNGNTPIAATFTPSGSGLMPDSTETYTFATTFMAPGNGFNICAKTSLPGDQYPQNNELCKNVVSTPASIDVGVVSIDASPNNGDTTYMSNNTLVTVKVVNFGLDTQTSIPLSYVYAGVTGGNETWTGSIAQGDTATFTFTSSYTSPVGNYQLCVTASLSGDAEVSNDEMCHGYVGMLVGLEDANGIQFTVGQNEPNPAFGKVSIDYVLPKAGKVHFELRNALGQVITSTEETNNSGNNTMVVDASKLSNGVYYYTFEFDGKRITHKMVVSE